MPTPLSVPTRAEARDLLHFAASFLWADLCIADGERAFLRALASELAVDDDVGLVDALLTRPPAPDTVDPSRVRPELAGAVRTVALRAIAADGRVEEREMDLFEVLDALLPEGRRSGDQRSGDQGERG